MTSMADILAMAAQSRGRDRDDDDEMAAPKPLPEAVIAELRSDYARYGKNPFKPGDLVTPIKGRNNRGGGVPAAYRAGGAGYAGLHVRAGGQPDRHLQFQLWAAHRHACALPRPGQLRAVLVRVVGVRAVHGGGGLSPLFLQERREDRAAAE